MTGATPAARARFRSAPAGLDGEGHDRRRNRRVEAVGAARHGDFNQEVAFGLIIGGKALLLVADQEEAGLAVIGFEIIVARLEAGPDQLTVTGAEPGHELGPARRGNRL